MESNPANQTMIVNDSFLMNFGQGIWLQKYLCRKAIKEVTASGSATFWLINCFDKHWMVDLAIHH